MAELGVGATLLAAGFYSLRLQQGRAARAGKGDYSPLSAIEIGENAPLTSSGSSDAIMKPNYTDAEPPSVAGHSKHERNITSLITSLLLF